MMEDFRPISALRFERRELPITKTLRRMIDREAEAKRIKYLELGQLIAFWTGCSGFRGMTAKQGRIVWGKLREERMRER